MAITASDIKLVQGITTTGEMTSNAFNGSATLFPAINTSDRVQGKLKLKKHFTAVRASLNPPLADVMTFINKLPGDEKINITLIKPESFYETKSDLKNLLENPIDYNGAYLVGYFDNATKGTSTVHMYYAKTTATNTLAEYVSQNIFPDNQQYISIKNLTTNEIFSSKVTSVTFTTVLGFIDVTVEDVDLNNFYNLSKIAITLSEPLSFAISGSVTSYPRGFDLGNYYIINTTTRLCTMYISTLTTQFVGAKKITSSIINGATSLTVASLTNNFIPADFPSANAENLLGFNSKKVINTPQILNVNDVVVITDSINEDVAMITGISGTTITFSPAVTHSYAAGSLISSAILHGDIVANSGKESNVFFGQQTWAEEFSDTLIGSKTQAQYNDSAYSITLNSVGTEQDRWACVFTSSSAFYIVGERTGVLETSFSTSADCEPINPKTGQPFFKIDYRGWGSGWRIGNVLRFNTYAAADPFWIAQTISKGLPTDSDYSFSLAIRGEI